MCGWGAVQVVGPERGSRATTVPTLFTGPPLAAQASDLGFARARLRLKLRPLYLSSAFATLYGLARRFAAVAPAATVAASAAPSAAAAREVKGGELCCVVVFLLPSPPGTEWRAGRPRAGESGESATAWSPQAGSCLRCRREAARPSEPNQCWTWRWCLNALWGTSNGNSLWVSAGSFRDTLRWPLPLWPLPLLVSALDTPAPAILRLFISSTWSFGSRL